MTTRDAKPTVQCQAHKIISNAEKALSTNALRCERLKAGNRSVSAASACRPHQITKGIANCGPVFFTSPTVFPTGRIFSALSEP
jgi:hypothetical protein